MENGCDALEPLACYIGCMGDRNPKSVQKQAAQKQSKANQAQKQKGAALAAKQSAGNPKRGK